MEENYLIIFWENGVFGYLLFARQGLGGGGLGETAKCGTAEFLGQHPAHSIDGIGCL